MRAQTSLPALGVALVLLVTTTLFVVSVADGQLASADREAVERETALALSERLVSGAAPVTVRENVVSEAELGTLSVQDLRDRYGLGPEDAVEIRLAGQTQVAAGSPDGGATVERIVLVQNRSRRTIEPRFARSYSVTLPRRSTELTIDVATSGNGTVETVQVNGGVVLHDADGLAGTYTVDVSRYETATLTVGGTGRLQAGDVVVTYRPSPTRKARLQVTVQRWGDPDG